MRKRRHQALVMEDPESKTTELPRHHRRKRWRRYEWEKYFEAPPLSLIPHERRLRVDEFSLDVAVQQWLRECNTETIAKLKLFHQQQEQIGKCKATLRQEVEVIIPSRLSFVHLLNDVDAAQCVDGTLYWTMETTWCFGGRWCVTIAWNVCGMRLDREDDWCDKRYDQGPASVCGSATLPARFTPLLSLVIAMTNHWTQHFADDSLWKQFQLDSDDEGQCGCSQEQRDMDAIARFLQDFQAGFVEISEA